jgi:4-amino-4-deoxy-L-arabinose transferase-like glycosyltransferase
MLSSRFSNPWIWFFVFALLFSAQVIPRIVNDSPTDDEPMDIADGYNCWKGDVISNGTHPVFLKMLQTLPLKFINVKDADNWNMGLEHLQARDSLAIANQSWGKDPSGLERFKSFLNFNMGQCQLRGYQFLFVLNKDIFENMIQRCRFITFLFGLGIGLLLFLKTRLNRPAVYLSALELWAFEPTLSAFSAQCGSDVPAAFFFLVAVLAFQKHLENQNSLWSLASGALLGAAVCSKLSALFLLPGLMLLEAFHYFRLSSSARSFYLSKIFKNWAWLSAALLLFICVVYLPGTLGDKNHWFPLVYFWLNLASVINIFSLHHPTYFLGMASPLNHWLYFPAAFALKSTLPFSFLTAGVIIQSLRKKDNPAWLWLPALVFFVFILPVQNLGVRYLLPIYPFLILMASFLLAKLWSGKPALKLLVVGLLLWHAVSVLASAPNMISYYNDLISWKKKVYYLGDSNIDMGQDVKRLAETAKQRGWKNIKLAQFGGAVEPTLYGMNWNRWTQKDLSAPQPGTVYVANVLLFQLGPIFAPTLAPIARGWATAIPATGRVGDTWIYFEIPGELVQDGSPSVESVKIF